MKKKDLKEQNDKEFSVTSKKTISWQCAIESNIFKLKQCTIYHFVIDRKLHIDISIKFIALGLLSVTNLGPQMMFKS